eukprot:11219175-Lingulodinium_polyedra.AAC.1
MAPQLLTNVEPTMEVLIIDIRHRPCFGTLSGLRDIVTVPLQHISQTSPFWNTWSASLPAVDAPDGGRAPQ